MKEYSYTDAKKKFDPFFFVEEIEAKLYFSSLFLSYVTKNHQIF